MTSLRIDWTHLTAQANITSTGVVLMSSALAPTSSIRAYILGQELPDMKGRNDSSVTSQQ